MPFAIAGVLADGLVVGLVVATSVVLGATALGAWLYGVRAGRAPAS